MSHKHRIRANRAGKSSVEAPRIEPEHLGGSWYVMPDGTKVQGKAKALEAFKAFA